MRLVFPLLLGCVVASICPIYSGPSGVPLPSLIKQEHGEGRYVMLLTVPSLLNAPEPSEVCLSRSRVSGDFSISIKASETAHIIYQRGNGSLGALAPGEMEECQSAGCITHVRIVETVNGGVEWEELGPVLALTPETFQYDRQPPPILGSEKMAVVSCEIKREEVPLVDHGSLNPPSELGLRGGVSDVPPSQIDHMSFTQPPESSPPVVGNGLSPIPNPSHASSSHSDATSLEPSMQPVVSSKKPSDVTARSRPILQPGDCVMLKRPLKDREGMVGPFELRLWTKKAKGCTLYDPKMDRERVVNKGQVRPCNPSEIDNLASLNVDQTRNIPADDRAHEGTGSTVFREGDHVIMTHPPNYPELKRPFKISGVDEITQKYLLCNPVTGYVHLAAADDLCHCPRSEIPSIIAGEEKVPFKKGDAVNVTLVPKEGGCPEEGCDTAWTRGNPYRISGAHPYDHYRICSPSLRRVIYVKRRYLEPASATVAGKPTSRPTASINDTIDNKVVSPPSTLRSEGPRSRRFESDECVMKIDTIEGVERLRGPFIVDVYVKQGQTYSVFDPQEGIMYSFGHTELRRCTPEESSKAVISKEPIRYGDLVQLTASAKGYQQADQGDNLYRVVSFVPPYSYKLRHILSGKHTRRHKDSLKLCKGKPTSPQHLFGSAESSRPQSVPCSAPQHPQVGLKRKEPSNPFSKAPPNKYQQNTGGSEKTTGVSSNLVFVNVKVGAKPPASKKKRDREDLSRLVKVIA